MSGRRGLLGAAFLAALSLVLLTRSCGNENARSVPGATAPEGGSTTTVGLVASTTAISEPEGASTATALAQRWPIVAQLPHEAPGWRIDYRIRDGQLVLTVRLRALRLRERGAETYEDQLRRYKAQVLAWLGPGPWTIEWDPPEAAAV